MRLIKRYPNRKLYDTVAKQYVTLNNISQMIRDGEEVQVADHTSGEDLTALTLTQIIVEEEKRRAGFVPRSVLTGLVQAGGERLSTLRRALALPLEMPNQVDEEIDRRLAALIRRGELDEAQGMWLREKLLYNSDGGSESNAVDWWEQVLERMLARHRIPAHSDIEALDARLEQLLRKVDALLENDEAG